MAKGIIRKDGITENGQESIFTAVFILEIHPTNPAFRQDILKALPMK